MAKWKSAGRGRSLARRLNGTPPSAARPLRSTVWPGLSSGRSKASSTRQQPARSRDCAFGRHAQRVGLERHVGGELALALGGAVQANRTIGVLSRVSLAAFAVASRASVTARL